MKSSQWIAVLLLVLMVAGITVVTMYLGGNSSGGADVPAETPPSLTFAAKMYPQPGQKALTTEVGQTGHQDYWFVNASGQDVNVGLNDKGCTCSEVEITLAPDSWRPYIIGEAAGNAFTLPPRGMDSLATWMATLERDHLFPELPDHQATTVALKKDNSIRIPADAIGRVRLSWRQTEAKPLLTFADLWIGQRAGTVRALDAGIKIAEPIEATKEINVRPVDLRALEKMKDGTKASILCWSVTRRAFRIKAKASHERGTAEADPIEVGEPIPLTRQEIEDLESRQQHMVTVLSGYRIPVTVRAKAKDGTPIEWGYFRRYIELSSPDKGIEPLQVQVRGEVRGDVIVEGGKEGGSLNLGPFPKKRGARRTLTLRTDEEKLKLQLDAARLPKILKARLEAAEKSPGGSRSWKLHVEARPGMASGEFPRADDALYRDSALYITVEEQFGQPPRTIRIPVKGVAIN